MTYYVSQSAEDMGDLLRAAVGNTLGNTQQNVAVTTRVDNNANADTIKS